MPTVFWVPTERQRGSTNEYIRKCQDIKTRTHYGPDVHAMAILLWYPMTIQSNKFLDQI